MQITFAICNKSINHFVKNHTSTVKSIIELHNYVEVTAEWTLVKQSDKEVSVPCKSPPLLNEI